MKPENLSTSDFILHKVAPLFNKKGYMGTSLSDLTTATGLTKGAIYFNFKSKEDLAVEAFKLNVKKVVAPLAERLAGYENAVDKLLALARYYRGYYDIITETGGCPIVNVASDANSVNPVLFSAVKAVAKQLENDLISIVQNGKDKGEISDRVDANSYGRIIFGMIEGAVFLAMTHHDGIYLDNMMDLLEQLINEKLRK